MMEMAFLDHEQMRILVLDTKNRVVENISRYQGTVNSSVLRAAEIYRLAVIRNCPAVIICHNHPSGDPTPSPKDRRQFHRWLIGIDEDGIFINPELVAHTKHFAVASLPPRLMPAAATPHLMNG
jgi:DNA repair protein RadC